MATSKLDLSVVIPVYNGAASVPSLCTELMQFLEAKKLNYEIILVDDGSRDNSLDVLLDLASRFSQIKIISLFKNFGQINACMTGFRHSCGELIVLMDDDLQNAAEDIDKLIRKVNEGFDYVFATPLGRPRDSWRTWGSQMNSWIHEKFIGKPRNVTTSSFLIMTRAVLEQVLLYEGPYPYLAGLLFRVSTRCSEVQVEYRKRKYGTSGYNLVKLIALWANGITNFSILPLRLATYFGLIVSFIGLFFGLWLIARKILDIPVLEGWTSLQASIFLFSGAQMFCIGILGEYVGRLFMISNRQPQSAIRTKRNFTVSPGQTHMDKTDVS